MFFYLENRSSDAPQAVHILPAGTDLPEEMAVGTLYLQAGKQRIVTFTPANDHRLYLLGDPVFREEDVRKTPFYSPHGRLDMGALYATVRGHYTWFSIQPGRFACGNSLGAIFPVYYHKAPGNKLYLSSSAHYLAGKTGGAAPSRRYLLERLLFNYPFSCESLFEGIRLLGTHCTLSTSDTGIREERTWAIEDYFGEGREHSRNSLERLTEVFAAESRIFIPENPFAISFTGGFDGRTLVAAARHAGRSDFFTYSFGMPHEADVTFPAAQASKVGVAYRPILLDDAYVREHALESARAFMRLSDYTGNFGRPHYHFAAQQLATDVDYILTGNFGSELFRAMHQPGVMISEALIRLFADNGTGWKDFLVQTAGEKAAAYFRPEMEALIADLEQYLQNKKHMEPNRRFYVFVLEEIFRKYFGAEMLMQSHYLRNRTPYLSLNFMKALNETIWSGVHTRLFEKQKNKRLKGQMFYSAFLRRTDPVLYRLPTNKGYSPADVLQTGRRPLLLLRVLYHKLFGRETGDSNAVESWFNTHRQTLTATIQASKYPELYQSGIADRMETTPDIPLEQAIHLYSLAAARGSAG